MRIVRTRKFGVRCVGNGCAGTCGGGCLREHQKRHREGERENQKPLPHGEYYKPLESSVCMQMCVCAGDCHEDVYLLYVQQRLVFPPERGKSWTHTQVWMILRQSISKKAFRLIL